MNTHLDMLNVEEGNAENTTPHSLPPEFVFPYPNPGDLRSVFINIFSYRPEQIIYLGAHESLVNLTTKLQNLYYEGSHPSHGSEIYMGSQVIISPANEVPTLLGNITRGTQIRKVLVIIEGEDSPSNPNYKALLKQILNGPTLQMPSSLCITVMYTNAFRA